jgi:S-adenosylmethionine/arginine decarboxylase-like enzyme
MSWGYHLIIDAAGCRPSAIRSYKSIYNFSNALVRRIDMKPFGEPHIVHFGTDGKMGYTLVQLIETSNICAHFCEETNDMYLDVFSCKQFCPIHAQAVVDHFFKPQRVSSVLMNRQAPQLK